MREAAWAAAALTMYVLIVGAPQPGGPAIGGHLWTSPALASLGAATTPAYARLVAKARAAMSKQAQEAPPRTRPLQKPARAMRTSCEGGPFVKPPHLRLCDESKDKCEHVEQSKALPFPLSSTRYELTPDCVAAIQTMAAMSGEELATWRCKQTRTLAAIAGSAKRMTFNLFKDNQNVPASVKFLRDTINVCFIAILCDAMQWPDVDVCRELTRGFSTAGDLRAQDSNVFRPADRLIETVGTRWQEVQASGLPSDGPQHHKELVEALAAGRTQFSPDALEKMEISGLDWDSVVHAGGKCFTPVPFHQRWEEFSTEEASLSWLTECAGVLKRKGEKALREAESGKPEQLALLRAVQTRTAEEIGVGHVGEGMNSETLVREFSGAHGFTVRVAPRFGIWQGLKMKQNSEGQEVPFLDAEGDEVWKLRCIDDFKFNGVNEVTWLSEQLVMPSFEFPARVAAEFSSILDKQGPLGKRARASDNGPGLLLGLDDLFAVSPPPCPCARHASGRKCLRACLVPARTACGQALVPARTACEQAQAPARLTLARAQAYRRIPNKDSRRFGIVGIYNLDSGEVVWHEVKGLPFGLSSAPSIFNRVPAMLCAFARVWLGIAVDQFVDDYICVDRDDSPVHASQGGGETWSSSAQWGLDRLHSLCGLELEPSKRKTAKPVNVLLGVEGDLSGFKDSRQVKFRPTERRCRAILAQLSRCQREDKMTPRVAANLLGRLTFILSSTYTSVGRAATQPLVDRASAKRTPAHLRKWEWTASMTHMLHFFQALFHELPPLNFDFRAKPKAKIILYTDASISPDRNGLGFIAFDQESKESWWCEAACPQGLMEQWKSPEGNPWLLKELAGEPDLDTHINAMELLGVLAAVWTLGEEVLQDRDVLVFIDNTAAMSATVHGYARSPNMAALSNTLHLALASVQCNVWVEWVPSDANCADIPSRPHGPESLEFYKKLGCARWPGGMRFPSLAQIRAPRLNDILRQST